MGQVEAGGGFAGSPEPVLHVMGSHQEPGGIATRFPFKCISQATVNRWHVEVEGDMGEKAMALEKPGSEASAHPVPSWTWCWMFPG